MNISKLVKVLLALTASSALLWSVSAQAKTPTKTAVPADAGASATVASTPRTVDIKVTEKGYEPSPITLKKGEPVKLVVTRTTEQTCATEIIIDKTDINVPLPLNKPVEVAFTPQEAGKLKFGCHMGKMVSGVFLVE